MSHVAANAPYVHSGGHGGHGGHGAKVGHVGYRYPNFRQTWIYCVI